MYVQTIPTPSDLAPRESEPAHAPSLAYLELDERQVFGLACILHSHFRYVGAPTTPLQHELAGLRDYLIDLLRDRHADVLLASGE